MSIRSRFMISWQKILKAKNRAVKNVVCLALVVFMISFLSSFSIAASRIINTLVYERASLCYVDSQYLPDRDIMREVTEYKHFDYFFGDTVPFSKVTAKIDGKEYRSKPAEYSRSELQEEFDNELWFDVTRLYEGSSIYSKVDLKELDVRFNKQNCIIRGKGTLGKNEILIADFILGLYGFTENDYPDLMGKEFEFSYTTHEGETIELGPYKLAGIIDADFFRLSGNSDISLIVIGCDDPKDERFGSENYRFYSDTLEDSSHLLDMFKSLGIEELYNPVLEAYNVLNLFQRILIKVLVVIVAVIALALLSAYLMMAYFEYCEEKNFEQIQKVIGMKEKDLFAISMIKELFYIITAAAIGGVLAYVSLSLIDIETYWYLDMHIIPSDKEFWMCFLLTSLGCFMVGLIKTIIYRLALKHEPLAETLSSGEM